MVKVLERTPKTKSLRALLTAYVEAKARWGRAEAGCTWEPRLAEAQKLFGYDREHLRVLKQRLDAEPDAAWDLGHLLARLRGNIRRSVNTMPTVLSPASIGGFHRQILNGRPEWSDRMRELGIVLAEVYCLTLYELADVGLANPEQERERAAQTMRAVGEDLRTARPEALIAAGEVVFRQIPYGSGTAQAAFYAIGAEIPMGAVDRLLSWAEAHSSDFE